MHRAPRPRRLGRALPLALLAAAAAIAPLHAAAAQATPVTKERPAAPAALQQRLQALLDSARTAGGWPGATLGVALADGRTLALATGLSDTAQRTPMRPQDRLLQGSVGKTYVSAVALQLVHEGKLDLDAKISRYLGQEPWFARLPNAPDVTVRQLMNHTSGLVRYEFQPAATAVLRADPTKTWTVADRLGYILDTAAPFAAGQGWEYSDTNYIVLGAIIERLTGQPYYAELRRRILEPHGLHNTIPSDRQELPGVVVGYAGPGNDLGGYDASIVNGRFAINPQFEWTGGGIAGTTEELARWATLLYEGKAFDASLLPQLLAGVPSRLGPNTRYGLGVIIRPSPLGETYGHSGFFPGYATDMLYVPATRTAVALQVNSTNPYPRGMYQVLVAAARIVGER